MAAQKGNLEVLKSLVEISCSDSQGRLDGKKLWKSLRWGEISPYKIAKAERHLHVVNYIKKICLSYPDEDVSTWSCCFGSRGFFGEGIFGNCIDEICLITYGF